MLLVCWAKLCVLLLIGRNELNVDLRRSAKGTGEGVKTHAFVAAKRKQDGTKEDKEGEIARDIV